MTPDALASAPRSLKMEILDGGKRNFQDDRHRVEIYDIGATSHAQEMIVAYLPNEKIIFQSDLFNPVIPGGEEPIAFDDPYHGVDAADTQNLLRFIREKNLTVEKILGSHGRIGTMTELIREAQQK